MLWRTCTAESNRTAAFVAILNKHFITLVVLGLATGMVARGEGGTTSPEPSHHEPTTMNVPTGDAMQVSPDVARYRRGMTPESRQFDFLIGDWNVAVSRYKPDGSLLLQYQGGWNARYLNEGRMVLDDFKAFAPTGEEISSYVTLRTYSQVTHRWEMSGLAAFQPATAVEWYGEWKDGEMRIEAFGKDPKGNPVRNRIRFFLIEKDRFSWESNVSFDDGRTWILASSLTATRAVR
jgi:hypothetical protein